MCTANNSSLTYTPSYFSVSIEDDILNLMDEVNLDEFLKEMSDAIDDPEKLSQYIREKATIAVERFLVSCDTTHFG